MKRRKLLVGCLLTALVLVAGTAFVLTRPAKTEWPDFLVDRDNPQYNTSVAERDFGFRTGNLVPVSLYFKLQKGMEILTDQLVLNGDFQLVSKTEYREKHGDVTLVRVDLVLQSFVYKPKLELKPTVSYRNGTNETKKYDLLPVEVYTSATYDGRKSEHPKENDQLATFSGRHLLYTLGFVLVGGIGLVYSISMLVRSGKPKEKKEQAPAVVAGPLPTGWSDVQAAWATVTGGDRSSRAVGIAVQAMRDFFKVDTQTVGEIGGGELPQKTTLVAFLRICERSIFGSKPLAEQEVVRASAEFATLEQSFTGEPEKE